MKTLFKRDLQIIVFILNFENNVCLRRKHGVLRNKCFIINFRITVFFF